LPRLPLGGRVAESPRLQRPRPVRLASAWASKFPIMTTSVDPERLKVLAESYRGQAEFCRCMAAMAPTTAQEHEWLQHTAEWTRLAENAEGSAANLN
jgi:hypothetical protein